MRGSCHGYRGRVRIEPLGEDVFQYLVRKRMSQDGGPFGVGFAMTMLGPRAPGNRMPAHSGVGRTARIVRPSPTRGPARTRTAADTDRTRYRKDSL